MALSADKFTTKTNQAGGENGVVAIPIADSVHIYKGALVCIDTASGYLKPAADTSGYVFVGIAEEGYDNTVAGHVAGAKNIRVRSGVIVESMTVTSAVQTSCGSAVYATDDATTALTSTNFVYVGQVIRYVSAGVADVYIPPTGTSAPLTSISGLTATAGELNQLHSVSAGTTAASKALVVGASKDLDTLKLDTSLVLGVAASVAYSGTMALVVATPVITVAASHTTSATATVNCAATAPAGALLIIDITTDASGTCTFTFGTHFHTTATVAATASTTSTISFVGDGTAWCEIGRAVAMT